MNGNFEVIIDSLLLARKSAKSTRLDRVRDPRERFECSGERGSNGGHLSIILALREIGNLFTETDASLCNYECNPTVYLVF